MSDLVDFLNDRISEDEAHWLRQKAEGSSGDNPWMVEPMLREIEAKRRILAFSVVLDEDRYAGGQGGHYLREALASVYQEGKP